MKASKRSTRCTVWVLLVACVVWASPVFGQRDKKDKKDGGKSAIEEQLKKTQNVEGVDQRSEEEKKKAEDERKAALGDLTLDGPGGEVKPPEDEEELKIDIEKLEEMMREAENKGRKKIAQFTKLVEKKPTNPQVPEWRFQIAEAEWKIAKSKHLRDMRKWTITVSKMDEDAETLPPEPRPEFDPALVQYEIIVSQFPNYERIDEVLFKLGDGLVRAGRADEGVPKLRRLTQTYPDSKLLDLAYFALGEYYFEKRNTTFAQEFYGQVVTNYPKSKVANYALYKLGWTHFNMGDDEGFQEAIVTFKKVVENVDTVYGKCLDPVTLVLDENCLPVGEVSFRNQAINDLIVAYAEVDDGWLKARDYFTTKLDTKTLRSKMEMFAELIGDKGIHDQRIAIYRWLIGEDKLHPSIPTYAERIIDAHFSDNDEASVEGVIREFIDYFEPNGKWAITNTNDERASLEGRRFAEENLYKLAVTYLNNAQEAAKGGSADKQAEADKYYRTSRVDHESFIARYPDSKYAYDMNFYYAYLLDELSERSLQAVKKKHKKATDAYRAEAAEVALPDLKSAAQQFQKVIEIEDQAPEGNEIYTQVAANRQVFVYANILTTVDPDFSMTGRIVGLGSGKNLVAEDPIELTEQERDFVTSVEQYAALFPKDEDSTPGFLWRAADLYMGKNQYNEAAGRFDTLVTNFPDHEYAGFSVSSMFTLYNLAKNWPKIEYWAEWLIGRKNFKAYTLVQLEDAIGYSIQKQSVDLYAEKKYAESAQKIYSIKERFPKRDQLVIPAMYIAARTYRDGDIVGPAIEHFEEFIKAFPKNKRTPLATFELAALYERKTDFDKAADLLEALPERIVTTEAALNNPEGDAAAGGRPRSRPDKEKSRAEEEAAKSEEDFLQQAKDKAPKGLTIAINIRRGLKQWDKAIASSNIFLENYSDYEGGKYAQETTFLLGEIYVNAERSPEGIAQYEKFISQYSENKVASVRAHMRIARILGAEKERGFEKVQDKHFKAIESIAGGMSDEDRGSAMAYIAEMEFMRAERKFEEMLAVKLEFPQRTLNKRVKKKFDLIIEAKTLYEKVFALKQATWATAAAYRLGGMYIDLRDQVQNLPIPADIQNDPDKLDEYTAFLEDSVIFPAEEKAIGAFQFALKFAHERGVYNEWSRKSAAMLTQIEATKNDYPVTSEKGVDTEHAARLMKSDDFLLSAVEPPPPPAPPTPPAGGDPANPDDPAAPPVEGDGADPAKDDAAMLDQ